MTRMRDGSEGPGPTTSEMARDIVVALVESGKIHLDPDPKKQGDWLGDLFKTLHQKIVVEGALEMLIEDQIKKFDLEDLRQLRQLLDAEIAARS